MPTLAELRAAKRFDLYNALPHHGGISVVAERLGLTVQVTAKAGRKRRPR